MARSKTELEKATWSGVITSVQPRIRLMRSFDQRYHSYLGYVLRIEGTCGDETGAFLIAVGKAAHAKHQFRAGMEASGMAVPVADPRLETAGYYRVSRLRTGESPADIQTKEPPFTGVPPDLETYRARGHRRLSARTYMSKCSACIWGCRMPVETIIDQWKTSRKQYRFETFCYGPKSCPFYRAGIVRRVPGRKGMSYTDEDLADEEAVAHRDPDR